MGEQTTEVQNDQQIPARLDPNTPSDVELTQQTDTVGNDENGDGVTAGQATADNHGDVLGI